MDVDLTAVRWTKSTYSPENGGNCVEWAPAYASTTGTVPVRDSKSPAGPAMMVSADAFAGLVALARSADL
ncbi:DUF397 domain-containing protein [Streptomyces yaizuensis]|uniref:DUF397 domain-containing protein n=1 Tax=Streptomyces yaizuensis TaxID=2989713 RepID=A0ABQ5NUE0_9ACTN|nr:DUF397 domain-containing protein [Streptomyces sp. YSPA8]GLF93986.1 DUF397 domain-containing protein [Streptomyces sp. YSPA8]